MAGEGSTFAISSPTGYCEIVGGSEGGRIVGGSSYEEPMSRGPILIFGGDADDESRTNLCCHAEVDDPDLAPAR